MRKIERKVDSFKAQQERGGPVTIDVYQEYHDATTMGSDGIEWIAGMRRYEIAGGAFLNKTGETSWEDPATGAKYWTRS